MPERVAVIGSHSTKPTDFKKMNHQTQGVRIFSHKGKKEGEGRGSTDSLTYYFRQSFKIHEYCYNESPEDRVGPLTSWAAFLGWAYIP